MNENNSKITVETADSSNEYLELESLMKGLEESIHSETYASFQKIYNNLKSLKAIPPIKRNSEIYSLMSSYSLILLSSTYDMAIKEIFKYLLKSSLSDLHENSSGYIINIINNKILNKYFTNIKHKVLKESLLVQAPGNAADLQRSILIVNDLISARNNLAHGINPESKTHTDLEEALNAVLIYLNWFKSHLISEKLLLSESY